MKFFSGFCLKNEKNLFKDYLVECELCVAGFSKGAQEALKYVVNSSQRIELLQLFSPAFFKINDKYVDYNLKAFKKDKRKYIKNFLEKAGLENNELIDYDCDFKNLEELFKFDWNLIKDAKCRIEIYIGSKDKIISVKEAYDFFKNYGMVYYIKDANHFLRS
jgi:hypothetical protein